MKKTILVVMVVVLICVFIFSLYSREDGSEISLTFKTGEDSYKIDYFSIDANVTYVIEQLENTNADPYHWHIYWYVKTPKVDYLGEE